MAIEVDPTLFPQDRYVPIQKLGSGAAGSVYLCEDKLLGKQVAVKTLRVLDAEQLMAFQQEARATSKLSHPNIVTTLDFGATETGKPYMVMELFGGHSLAQHITEIGPLDEETAIPLFEKICWALHYAHEKGVFHRDLKPGNLIVSEDEKGHHDVQIIDFGVAKIKQESQEPTIIQGRTVTGTPAYMSPDQAAGLPYDARSEIYALGCAMFEAMTGRVPFIGESAMETITMHANSPPPVPSDFVDEISKNLDEIILRCLAKKPTERFQSMRELGSEFASLQESRGEKSDFQPSASVRRQRKSLVLPVVIVLIVLIPAAMFIAYQSLLHDDEERHKKARLDNQSKSFDEDRETWDSIDKATTDYVTVDTPTGRQLSVSRKFSMDDVKFVKRAIKEKGINQLCFNLCELTPELLEPFADEKLNMLMFDHNAFSEEMFEIISRIRTLQTLSILYASPAPTAGIAHLKKLKNLRHLIMAKAQTEPDVLNEITQMKQLRILQLSYCPIGGKLPEAFAQMQELKSLNIRATHCDDDLALVLPKLKSLERLIISENEKVTGVTLKALSNQPFQLLALGFTSVRASDLVYLRDMPLICLDVAGLGLNDSAIKYVDRPSLKRLCISHNAFTDKALARFSMRGSLVAIDVSSNPDITKIGINALTQANIDVTNDPKEIFPLGDEFSVR